MGFGNRRKWAAVAMAALVGTYGAAAARAAVVATTFGPDMSFNGGSVRFISSGGEAGGIGFSYYELAVAFMPTSTYTLDSITLGVNSYGSINSAMNVKLRNDGGNVPGNTVIESMDGTFGFGELRQTVTSTTNPLLQAGKTYWIDVSSPQAGAVAVWYSNDQNLYVTSAQKTQPDQATWAPNGSIFAPAFEVNGTPVPEPTAVAVVGVACVALGARRKRASFVECW